MAYVDFRLSDELNVRAGRFNPTFGEYGLRHDPANHRTSDAPLPYDMGRMLRLNEFNRSVLPSPYVDNGIELSGSHFFGRTLQIDYALHAVAGLRATTDQAYDVDFAASHTAAPYYIDNNSIPSVGGRLGATIRLAERLDLSLGGSAIYGPYDPSANLNYLILGADLFLRAGRTNLRAEFLIRRTDMYVGSQARFENVITPLGNGALPTSIFQIKEGWYVELEQPLTRNIEAVLRWDGLRRLGNVAPGSPINFDAGVSRYTLGANFVIERSYRLKASVAYNQFWGMSDRREDAVAVHFGAVATF